MIYDVVIIGAGPAGLFAAYKLLELDRNLKIIIIDKGKSYETRECPVIKGKDGCTYCGDCELISGEGGAGLFSDGKIVFTLDTGTNISYGQDEKLRVLKEIKCIFERFNGDFIYRNVSKTIKKNEQALFDNVGLKIDFFPVLHVGSFHLKNIMKNFLSYLRDRDNISFLLNTEVIEIKDWERSVKNTIVKLENSDVGKRSIKGKNLIFAMGKEGSFSLSRWMKEAGLEITGNRCYFGVRIELPTETLKRLFDISPNPKIYKYYDDETIIKTHCFCKDGRVLLLKYYGLPLLGGHTYKTDNSERKTSKKQTTNFAVLLGAEMGYPDIVEQSLRIMKKTNALAHGHLLVQRMGDFLLGVPTSTNPAIINNGDIKQIARPGNIADINFPFDFRSKFIDFVTRMNQIIPGVIDNNNLIYAPAIEWWMPKIENNKEMETKFEGIYVIGDGSGSSQGIVQSIAPALIAAKSLYNKMRSKSAYYDKAEEKFLQKGNHPSFQRDIGESASS